MEGHAHWMHRCLQLARNGAGTVAPNPMVGAVLVHNGRSIAEGWHAAPGGPHAEVNCLHGVQDDLPLGAVLYVSLEPCAHHGRTPPCADLLVRRGVQHVVIAHEDPFPKVAGKGIERLRAAGVEVTVGIEERAARWTNRRFLTGVQDHRPYIILKWARSVDGYLDRHPRTERTVQRISSAATDVLVHRWRGEEQAVLVGSRTVVNDDPSLTVRHVTARQPLRVVLDRQGVTPSRSKVYDGEADTLLFTGALRPDVPADQILLAGSHDPIDRLLAELHHRQVLSLIVEGGGELLGHFIARGLWDEARVITGGREFGDGTPAPVLPATPSRSFTVSHDRMDLHVNPSSPSFGNYDTAWDW